MTPQTQTIIAPILQKFGCTLEQVTGRSRRREIAYCRFFCILELRRKTTMTLQAIADEFGIKDHASVSHCIKRAENLETDPKMKHILAPRIPAHVYWAEWNLYGSGVI